MFYYFFLQLPEIEFFHSPYFLLGQKPTQTADTAEILLMLLTAK